MKLSGLYIKKPDGTKEYFYPKMDHVSLGNGYGTCSTAPATSAKTVTIFDFELTQYGSVVVRFINDVPANATLNISGTGARPIYFKNAPITVNTIKGGDTVSLIYDGTVFHVSAVDTDTTEKVDKSGDTIYGQINKEASACTIIEGRNKAMIATTEMSEPIGTAYCPIISAKSYEGSWDVGPHESNTLHVSYIKDSDVTSSNVKRTADYVFSADGNLSAVSFTGDLNGTATNASKLGGELPSKYLTTVKVDTFKTIAPQKIFTLSSESTFVQVFVDGLLATDKYNYVINGKTLSFNENVPSDVEVKCFIFNGIQVL